MPVILITGMYLKGGEVGLPADRQPYLNENRVLGILNYIFFKFGYSLNVLLFFLIPPPMVAVKMATFLFAPMGLIHSHFQWAPTSGEGGLIPFIDRTQVVYMSSA